MNIVVTDLKIDYSGFMKLSSMEMASETKGFIDFLVYHKSDEASDALVQYFSMMKDRVGKYIYIRNPKDEDPVVKMMVMGLKGHSFDDEFFMENPIELLNLINSLDQVTEIAEMGGVGVLSDFLARYLKNGSTSFTPRYLVSVKEAVQSLMEEYNQKNMELLQMSETATELFTNTSEVLASMRREHGELQKTVLKLEKEVKSGALAPSMGIGRGGGISQAMLFFPQVSYMKDKRIIRIKELGNVRYLTSFMLGFRVYLETIKNVRPKLIFVEPTGDLVEKRYSEYAWVSQKSLRERKYYYQNIVFTNHPNKEILTSLLDDTDYDTFIVVDRTLSAPNHILNSRGNQYFAVEGNSVINRLSLNVRNCFTCCREIKGCLFYIPTWEDYPDEKSFRERAYLTNMSSAYALLT